jgi:hypothetical protein
MHAAFAAPSSTSALFGQVDAHNTAQTKKFERCSNWRKGASGDDTFGFGIDRYGLAIDGLAAMTKARRS